MTTRQHTPSRVRIAETLHLIAAWTRESTRDLAPYVGATDDRPGGVDHTTVSRLLRQGPGNLDHVDDLCRHWGITLTELLAGFGWLEEKGRLPRAVRDAKATGQQLLA